MHKLYVCQTCQRDARLAPGTRSRGALLSAALARALERADLDDVLLVRVACLNGCLNPCNLALRATRKYSLRLSRINEADAPAVLELLAAYTRHETGDVEDRAWPESLVGRLSARVPPPHLLIA